MALFASGRCVKTIISSSRRLACQPMLALNSWHNASRCTRGVRARIAGFGPPLGFLLGARHFKSSVSHYQIGERYRATCQELIRDDSGMGSYDCTILLGDERVAEARLAVLEKERGQKLGE